MKLALALLAFFGSLLPLTAKENAAIPEKPGARQQLAATLQAKTFPEVVFQEQTLASCVAWMKKQGLPVELSAGAIEDTKQTRLTLTLHNVPAIELLKYVTNLTNTKYLIEDSKVTIQPLSAP